MFGERHRRQIASSVRLGDTKVVTAEHYMFAIGDYAEVEYAPLLR